MRDDPAPILFDDKLAAAYDQRFARVAALRAALDLLINLTFTDLPEDARVLVVGAGTGAELKALAVQHPGWHFTAVEPAPAMLAACRRCADELGIIGRCDFHEGYLDTLPTTAPYDAATSVLVSQFIVDVEARRAFFSEIHRRLGPGGHLISVDLATAEPADRQPGLAALWQHMLRYTGTPEEALAGYWASLDRHVAVRPPTEVEALIASAGFTPPVRFIQTLMIHGWHARRPD